MKKIFSLLSILCVAIFANAETVFEFTSAADLNQTKDGITVVIAQGSGQNAPKATTDYETSKPEMRLFLGNTITVSSSTALKNIQMVFAKSSASNKEYTGLEANAGTLVSGGNAANKNDWKVDSWTGNATMVVFTLTGKGQRRIQKLVIDGAPITLEDETIPLPTEADLKADYEYSEPTVVHPKDTTIFKKEYAFIENNILVHCDSGSIIKATDTTFAYFNCPVGSKLTFTATQNIKGIAIDGFVRKAFDGVTCETGSVTYLTDPDADEEGFPAIVIQDVNAKSVTLSCPKQFRCYELRVYFKENPEAIDMGGEEPEDPEDPENPENPEDQAIDNVQNNDVQSTKVLRDGQLIILRGDKEYNSFGTQL